MGNMTKEGYDPGQKKFTITKNKKIHIRLKRWVKCPSPLPLLLDRVALVGRDLRRHGWRWYHGWSAVTWSPRRDPPPMPSSRLWSHSSVEKYRGGGNNKKGLHAQIELEVDKGGEAVQSFPCSAIVRGLRRWVTCTESVGSRWGKCEGRDVRGVRVHVGKDEFNNSGGVGRYVSEILLYILWLILNKQTEKGTR